MSALKKYFAESGLAFPSCNNRDEYFMLEALNEAFKAFQKDEVPVGAVLVFQDRVISRGHNQMELLQDATAHAEMLCLTAGSAQMENWRLKDTTLYVTLEPCLMCAGALILSRVKKLLWSSPDLRHGAGGSWINVFEEKHPIHRLEVESGIFAPYSALLMRNFFKTKR